MEERISVAQILELGVSITWQQAVAVTLEAWHGAENAHVRHQPLQLDTESCALTLKGDVILPRPAAVYQPDGALELLRALLNGIAAPPELVEVAFGNSVATLSDDLALFSRPNRRVEIADVAQRGLAARAALAIPTPIVKTATAPATPPPPPASGSVPDDAFATLRQEAAARAPEPAMPRAAAAPAPRRRWVLALAGTAAAIVAVTVWRAWPMAAPAAPMAVVLEDAPLEPSPPDPSWSAAGQRISDVHLARRPAASVTARPAAPSTTSVEASAALVTDAPAAAATGSTSASSSPATEASPAVAAEGITNVEDTAVYTWLSTGVEPPTMVFPRMPRSAFPESDDNIDDLPYLEVLVNERGSVDSVRLRGNVKTSDAVRHGMMMAPAKAWQFAPATRNGQPVRYVVRVLVGQ